MASKSTFTATNSAAKSNSAINKEAESRIKALRAQATKASKAAAKTQKIQQKKLGGK